MPDGRSIIEQLMTIPGPFEDDPFEKYNSSYEGSPSDHESSPYPSSAELRSSPVAHWGYNSDTTLADSDPLTSSESETDLETGGSSDDEEENEFLEYDTTGFTLEELRAYEERADTDQKLMNATEPCPVFAAKKETSDRPDKYVMHQGAFDTLAFFVVEHDFYQKARLTFPSLKKSERKQYKRDIYDFGRALGLKRPIIKDFMEVTGALLEEKNYDSDVSSLGTKELDNTGETAKRLSSAHPSYPENNRALDMELGRDPTQSSGKRKADMSVSSQGEVTDTDRPLEVRKRVKLSSSSSEGENGFPREMERLSIKQDSIKAARKAERKNRQRKSEKRKDEKNTKDKDRNRSTEGGTMKTSNFEKDFRIPMIQDWKIMCEKTVAFLRQGAASSIDNTFVCPKQKLPHSAPRRSARILGTDTTKALDTDQSNPRKAPSTSKKTPKGVQSDSSKIPKLPKQRQVSSNISPYFPNSPQKPSPSKRAKALAVSPYFLDSTPKKSIGKTSCIPFPALDSETFGLVQERLADDPFRLLVAVIFLNKTRGAVAMPVFYHLMEKYPTAADLASAKQEDIMEIIQHLGLQNQRSATCINLARAWLERPPVKEKRYRLLHYPAKGDGRDVRPDEILDESDSRVAWEVAQLPGVGTYAIDSWRIFCRDQLRGKGQDPEMDREWTRVLPLDKELRAYLRWRWLRNGWKWNPLNGEKKKAEDAEMLKAQRGGVIIEGEEEGLVVGKEAFERNLEKAAKDLKV